MDKKEIYTKVFLKAAGEIITDEKIKEKKIEWWFNVRSKDEGGLRLTEAGIDFILEKSKIKTYEVELPDDIKTTPQILIWLDKFINSPYYFDKRKIIVSEEKTAFELYLFSGDVRKMGYSKAMSRRINSDQSSS
jgi:hypothetical protein